MKVYITKYALTRGILLKEVKWDERDARWAIIPPTKTTYEQYYRDEGVEWHRTWESALARAEEMRRSKIVSLNKQLTKMHELKFTRPEED